MENPFETFVKVAILSLLAPIWWPVIRTLYEDFEAALWREGGLFGREPTGEKLKELELKYADYEDPLISVPKQRRGGRMR